MTCNDLISACAVEIMGYHRRKWGWADENNYDEIIFGYGIQINKVPIWNPLTNSNHTDMLRDKLLDLGFIVSEFYVGNSRSITVEIRKESLLANLNGKSINLTRCKAYLEAIRKWRENNE